MSREIRHVPENWDHPKKADGQYRPMFKLDFQESYNDWKIELDEWYECYERFEHGESFGGNYGADVINKANCNTYEDYGGQPPVPPNPYDYMPKGDWVQLFESVSEGTPISPPFKTKQELIDYLVKNGDFIHTKWSQKAAEDIVNTEWAPSGIMSMGKIYKPEEQYQLKNNEN